MIFSNLWRAGCIALGLAFAVVWMVAAHRAEKVKELRDELATVELNLALSNESINVLEQAIEDMNRQAEERAAEYEAREKALAADNRKLAKRARSTEKRIDRILGGRGDVTCSVADETLRELEGL